MHVLKLGMLQREAEQVIRETMHVMVWKCSICTTGCMSQVWVLDMCQSESVCAKQLQKS